MAKVLVSDQYLEDIADAIREKTSSNSTYMPSEMAPAILSIPTSSETSPVLQSKTITPSPQQQNITADNGYDGLSNVVVTGDSNLSSFNIKHDTSIFGISGTFGVKIDSVTTSQSSRELSITFNGLKKQPLAFFCTQEGQTTFSKSYRWIISVSYDGTTVRNETHGVSGSSMIGYNFSNCTWTYSNGTLTITSPSSGANGYFKDGMTHRLIYIYEE